MKGTLIDILIVLAVPVILVGAFLYMQSGGSEAPATDNSLEMQAKKIKSDLDTLNSLTFDSTAFNYLSELKSFKYVPITIPKGNFEKRLNPFSR